MITFHARWYGRFVEIKGSLRRKQLHKTGEGSNFLENSFSNRDNARIPIQFGSEKELHGPFLRILFYQVLEIKKAATKKTTKTWLAKGATIFIHKTSFARNNACNTDQTTSFYVICDWYFCEFAMFTPTSN